MNRIVGVLIAQPRNGSPAQVRTFDPKVGPVHLDDFPSDVYRLFAVKVMVADDLLDVRLDVHSGVIYGARELHSLLDVAAESAPAAAPAEAAKA